MAETSPAGIDPTIVELVSFLSHSNPAVRATAVSHVLSLTSSSTSSSDDSQSFSLSALALHTDVIRRLATIAWSDSAAADPATASNALKALVNLATDPNAALAMASTFRLFPRLLSLLSSSSTTTTTTTTTAKNASSVKAFAPLNALLLLNITTAVPVHTHLVANHHSTADGGAFFESLLPPVLLRAFEMPPLRAKTDEMVTADAHRWLFGVAGSLSVLRPFQLSLLDSADDDACLLARFARYANDADTVRRVGVATTIRNCVVNEDLHDELIKKAAILHCLWPLVVGSKLPPKTVRKNKSSSATQDGGTLVSSSAVTPAAPSKEAQLEDGAEMEGKDEAEWVEESEDESTVKIAKHYAGFEKEPSLQIRIKYAEALLRLTNSSLCNRELYFRRVVPSLTQHVESLLSSASSASGSSTSESSSALRTVLQQLLDVVKRVAEQVDEHGEMKLEFAAEGEAPKMLGSISTPVGMQAMRTDDVKYDVPMPVPKEEQPLIEELDDQMGILDLD
eukprot:ANDGO_04553.mRNA.1 hypothetical protein